MRFATGVMVVAYLAAAVAAPSAHAERALLSEAALQTAHCIHCAEGGEGPPPPEGQIEGPCGLAVSPPGWIYLADYHHRTIDIFGTPSPGSPGPYSSQITLPGTNPRFGVDTLDGICGLAFDAEGNLYGNEWHQGVEQLTPGEQRIDSGESTGLAIDPSTDRLYVDDRTYLAEYALPLTGTPKPLRTIGSKVIGEGFGLAAAEGRVYVADAAKGSVEVFEPAVDPSAPVASISGQFHSLTDAALTIDPTDGHLLVVDDLQPGYEHPRSAVREFGSPAEGYVYLGSLPGAPIFGAPSGIAVMANGQLLVTDGNGELSNAFLYGSFEGGAGPLGALGPRPEAGAQAPSLAALATGGQVAPAPPTHSRPPAASASEVVQGGGVRVSVTGRLSPRRLPRRVPVPVHASIGAKITPLGEHSPPQLRTIQIAINGYGHFSPAALASCEIEDIQPATTSAALAACRSSLVGEGDFHADVLLPEQAPFPSAGKVFAFNGRWHGRPAILAHVYGEEPVPTSFTLVFALKRAKGTFGTVLRASLPEVTGDSGYITGLTLDLGHSFSSHGVRHSFISASCPAPAGFPGATFPFAHATFTFSRGPKLKSVLTRSCKVRGR